MAQVVANDKPHVVCIPCPLQSHIKAMLKLAKLLHFKGFHITYVNTEFNHNRLLKSLGPNSLDGFPDFRFETIPDGLPSSNPNATQDIIALCESLRGKIMAPLLDLLTRLSDPSPPVTRILSDGSFPVAVTAGEQLGIPVVLFYPIPVCAFMAIKQSSTVVEKLGPPPVLDDSSDANSYLDKDVDWIPGMKDMRVRDLARFCWARDTEDDPLHNFSMEATENAHKASAVVFHTFYTLEQDILDAISSMFPKLFAIGPLQLLLDRVPEDPLKPVKYSLWKEENECLQWLDTKQPNSVVYVNFGSIAVMSPQHLMEFGMGLANSKHHFLWIIRPDLVIGESAILPTEFVNETKGRGLIASWCQQEEVLNHSSIGGFLTHSGWNSTIESLSSGVPMLCWPFLGDQLTNCRYTCKVWGIGMEINKDVKRDEVEKLVRELMEGDKGKEMKKNVMKWKRLAEDATSTPNGSSTRDLDDLVRHLLL
ncbi:hypothetical protein FNV43_RR14795 [Rhamnella rubrinervis]|uniref:Glycosyltransferase n=1 Tax=Rhamnella rubrinervis TaxID=2594499 RepID=A0A8K0MGN3_9ROSA|nr:hypothetical protein FNV43_RR14795 [Rhamnella rubrinervis]